MKLIFFRISWMLKFRNVFFSSNQSNDKIQECCQIIADFPIKAKVVIADRNGMNLSNIIEK